MKPSKVFLTTVTLVVTAVMVFSFPIDSFGQGGTSKLPQYSTIVPPMRVPPTSDFPHPDELPGPAPQKWGIPQAPSIDHYFQNGTPDEWWPDEFRSNPDPTIKLKDLKGYHFTPFLRWVTIEKKVVKPGDTIRGQAFVEDPAGVARFAVAFQGPMGRRTTIRMSFTPRAGNKSMFDGTLTIPKWTEPGRYLPFDMALGNVLGHLKANLPEYVSAMQNLVLEVLPGDDIDVLPPTLEDFGIGTPGESTSEGVAQTYDISKPVMVWAKITDNKSGVRQAGARILSPDGKFKEVGLKPWMGKENYYVGFFQIPEHYEGGEYYTRSVWAHDVAGRKMFTYARINPMVQAARFEVTQDPAKVDSTAPEVITVWLDQTEGKLGDTIKVSMIVSDDLAGVTQVVANFAAYPSFADKKRIHLRRVAPRDVLQKAGFNLDEQIWEGTFTTHEMDEPGDWKLVRIFAGDAADNYLDIRRSERPDMLTVKVYLKGGVRNMDTPIVTRDEPRD